MSMLHQSRTARELAEIRANMAEMQRQINILVSHFAALPQPPRAGWERHSMPKWETNPSIETRILPTPRALAVLPRRIMRVTLCQSGTSQWVNAYDANGEKVPEYCGSFREVGRKILEREPHLRWETVAESA